MNKPRDGVWIANGLQADCRLIRQHAAGDDVYLVETAGGENWANGKELQWDIEEVSDEAATTDYP